MTRAILCLSTIICMFAPSLSLAGGNCRSRQSVRTCQAVYHPVRVTQPATQRVSRSAAPQYQPISRNVTPPPNYLPARFARTRPASGTVLSTTQRLDAAKQAFRIGHHNVALAHASTLIQQTPKNANLLQFRSLVYFRKGDHRRAALDAYEAVKHGAIWSTSTIEDLYAYSSMYKQELRTLRRESMTDLSTVFLSAYHHLVAGDLEQGRDALNRVLAIKPSDKIASALIQLIDKRQSSNTNDQLANAG